VSNEPVPLPPRLPGRDRVVAGGGRAGDHLYPLDLPAPPYGSAPDLALSYDSGTVDGRTSNSNNQASWVGQGWSISPPDIEREYKPTVNAPYDGNPSEVRSYLVPVLVP
jgi:hypothetical protein